MLLVFDNENVSVCINTMIYILLFVLLVFFIFNLYKAIILKREIKKEKLHGEIWEIKNKFYIKRREFYNDVWYLKGRELYDREKELDDIIESFKVLENANKYIFSKDAWDYHRNSLHYRKTEKKQKFVSIEDHE